MPKSHITIVYRPHPPPTTTEHISYAPRPRRNSSSVQCPSVQVPPLGHIYLPQAAGRKPNEALNPRIYIYRNVSSMNNRQGIPKRKRRENDYEVWSKGLGHRPVAEVLHYPACCIVRIVLANLSNYCISESACADILFRTENIFIPWIMNEIYNTKPKKLNNWTQMYGIFFWKL